MPTAQPHSATFYFDQMERSSCYNNNDSDLYTGSTENNQIKYNIKQNGKTKVEKVPPEGQQHH